MPPFPRGLGGQRGQKGMPSRSFLTESTNRIAQLHGSEHSQTRFLGFHMEARRFSTASPRSFAVPSALGLEAAFLQVATGRVRRLPWGAKGTFAIDDVPLQSSFAPQPQFR
jgi:hypothetical protein